MNQIKVKMTRHESLLKPVLNPQSINIELLFRQILWLKQERERLVKECEQLRRCNKSTNETNDHLLSHVAILKEVLSSLM
jgi:hypothetical protein